MLLSSNLHLLQLRIYTPGEDLVQVYALIQLDDEERAHWHHQEMTPDDMADLDVQLVDVLEWHQKPPPELMQ